MHERGRSQFIDDLMTVRARGISYDMLKQEIIEDEAQLEELEERVRRLRTILNAKRTHLTTGYVLVRRHSALARKEGEKANATTE